MKSLASEGVPPVVVSRVAGVFRHWKWRVCSVIPYSSGSELVREFDGDQLEDAKAQCFDAAAIGYLADLYSVELCPVRLRFSDRSTFDTFDRRYVWYGSRAPWGGAGLLYLDFCSDLLSPGSLGEPVCHV